jgi:pimeloyl-ACP methyl ester carboxylesterase
MKRKLHLIYVTGLGDSNPRGQRLAVKTWRWWGVKSEMFQMNWADGQTWQSKYDRLLKRIEQLSAEGKAIGLVGASAGAGVVINAFADRKDKIVGCVLIAGKVNRPGSIGESYKRRNPAFVDSSAAAPASLNSLNSNDRARILSRYAIADEMVQKSDSFIDGAHNRRVPTMGHFFTIATQITFGAPSFIRFLKRQAKH